MVLAAQISDPAGPSREARRTLRLEAMGTLPEGGQLRAAVHNISSGGLLIETEAALAVGDALDIELPHAGSCRAAVVWQSGVLHGCCFDQPISRAALNAAQLRSAVDRGNAVLPPARSRSSAEPLPDGVPDVAAESFAAQLQRLRKARGLSQADLARMLDVSKPTVWAWEQGRANPVGSRVGALAAALGVSREELATTRTPTSVEAAVMRARQAVARACGVRTERVRILIDI